jgi:hypothetical protein
MQKKRFRDSKYKLLSLLEARLLCIPATSAPSEYVFSVAGLTIAKGRARLASDTANKLIFLHDALPRIQAYLNNYTFEAGSSREEGVEGRGFFAGRQQLSSL